MWRERLREMGLPLGIGAGLAVVIFLLFQGLDLIPWVLIAGIGYAMVRFGGFSSLQRRFGKTIDTEERIGVTFEDVGGQGTAKKELLEALDFLVQRDLVKKLGIRPLKGILLSGPPGTGKTMLAKAAASYTKSAFLSTSGAEFIEMYAGVGAQRVRDLFRRAREMAKREENDSAIIFIDEIEVLGGKRGQNNSHLEYDQTLNQLLVEMDGMNPGEGGQVLVMAATNRADLLDPALLRPGRFDRLVRADLPDREGRRQILNIHARNKPFTAAVDLEAIAKESFGFSGAHLESLTNEAAILAMREGKEEIEQGHLLEAIDKVIMGEKLERHPGKDELWRIAVHEGGHSLVGERLRPGLVANITITSRGGALGYVRHAPQDDIYLQTQDYLQKEIAVLLAGSVAEEMMLGCRSTGAANDFEHALATAKKMVMTGMSEAGVVSEEIIPQAQLHRMVTGIIAVQEERARAMLEEDRYVLDKVAVTLLDRESLPGDELRRMLAREDALAAMPQAEGDGVCLDALSEVAAAGIDF